MQDDVYPLLCGPGKGDGDLVDAVFPHEQQQIVDGSHDGVPLQRFGNTRLAVVEKAHDPDGGSLVPRQVLQQLLARLAGAHDDDVVGKVAAFTPSVEQQQERAAHQPKACGR